LPIEKSCKAVVYQMADTGEYVVLFTRGDLEANETKISNYLKGEIIPATITPDSGLVAGYMGPVGLDNARILFDSSLQGAANLCCGANDVDYHYTGFQIERDYGHAQFHDFSKAKEGGICPECRKASLTISRGIEVGNIFQLGDKYTKAMDMKYTDADGVLQYPVMGCYGIGVGRLAASVCEAYHDDNGPIWPMAIAPWQVQICCLRADDADIKAYADDLYSQLKAKGVEVVYDDRAVSAGVMFSDADLLGVPVRVVVSPRNMKEGCCEVVTRDKSVVCKVACDEVVTYIEELICKLNG